MKLTIIQTAKPIRLAFLIKPGSKKSFQQCIQLSTSMWGGMHFPILPFYRKFPRSFMMKFDVISEKPRDFYLAAFNNFQVDFIVFDPTLDESVLMSFFEKEKLVSMELLVSPKYNRVQYGIGLSDILPLYLKENFRFVRTDGSKICFPIVDQNDLYLQTLLGTLSAENISKIQTDSPNVITYQHADCANLSDFFDSKYQGFFDVINFKLDGNDSWWSHGTIFFADPENLYDLMQFWNLRAMGRDVILLPVNDYQNTVYVDLIRRIISNHLKTNTKENRISVIGNNLPVDFDHAAMSSYLNSFLKSFDTDDEHCFSYQHWLPRFWITGYGLAYDRASAKSIYTDPITHNLENKNIITVPVLSIFPIAKEINDHLHPAYKNELVLQFSDGQGTFAEVVPEMSNNEAEKFLGRFGREIALIRGNRLLFYAHPFSTGIEFSLPKNEEVFELLYKRKDMSIRVSSAGKLAQLVLSNIGGIGGINFFMNAGIAAVLEMLERNRLVEHRELFAEIKKQIKEIRFFREPKAIVQRFIDYKVIQLGLKISCAFCNRSSFYEGAAIKATLKCVVCQNDFVPPMNDPGELRWAYQVSGPFNMSNRANGILSVLLTLRYFKPPLAHGASSFLLSYEIFKDKKCVNEVDLALYHQSFRSNSGIADLIFCECKTGADFKIKDVEKMKQLGKEFPGSILTFATLKASLSEVEINIIKKMAMHFRIGNKKRPACPILILTRNELLPKNPWDQFDSFENNKVYSSEPDDMGRLCELTTQKYLGLKPYSEVYEEYWRKKIQKIENRQTASVSSADSVNE